MGMGQVLSLHTKTSDDLRWIILRKVPICGPLGSNFWPMQHPHLLGCWLWVFMMISIRPLPIIYPSCLPGSVKVYNLMSWDPQQKYFEPTIWHVYGSKFLHFGFLIDSLNICSRRFGRTLSLAVRHWFLMEVLVGSWPHGTWIISIPSSRALDQNDVFFLNLMCFSCLVFHHPFFGVRSFEPYPCIGNGNSWLGTWTCRLGGSQQTSFVQTIPLEIQCRQHIKLCGTGTYPYTGRLYTSDDLYS